MDVCDMTHLYTWHDALINVTWFIHIYMTRLTDGHEMTHSQVTSRIDVCDMTHSCMWHDPSTNMTWLMYVSDMIHRCIWHDALIYVTWLIHIYDVPHWCIWDDSWTSMTRRTRMYALFIFLNEDSLIYMTWHINVCELTHSYSWRNALLYGRWLILKWVHSYSYEICLNASCHEHENYSFIIVTWRVHI